MFFEKYAEVMYFFTFKQGNEAVVNVRLLCGAAEHGFGERVTVWPRCIATPGRDLDGARFAAPSGVRPAP